MRIAFVDESGDIGGLGSPTSLFILCAVVMDHAHWSKVNLELAAMRRRLELNLSLRCDAEMHAAEFLSKHPRHLGLSNRSRFLAVRHALRTLAALTGTRYCRVAVRKGQDSGRTMESAWKGLLSEIAGAPASTNTACPSQGLVVVCDHHAARPYRPSDAVLASLPSDTQLLDLPYGRDSHDNPILQMADLLAYLSKQSLDPKPYFEGSQGRALVRLAETLFEKPCPVIVDNP